MAKQKQAEECVLYVRVSTTRQAEDGVSAKVPLWSRPAAKQMKAFILKQKIKHIFAYRMDRLFRSTIK